MTAFDPHPVSWTDDKVSRFWDYLAAHDSGGFFSETVAVDIARRLVRAAQPRTAVDIGCGTGPLVAEFARCGIRATGVDSSPDVLAAARERAPSATFHLGSVTAIPLPDASEDAATLIEVVEHLDDATLDSAIREAHRVVRPGGTLLITTPNAEDLGASTRQCPDCGAEFHVYQHVRRWAAESLRDYLEERGFTASVTGTRFVEQGPTWERAMRRVGYTILRQRPSLLAIATRRG